MNKFKLRAECLIDLNVLINSSDIINKEIKKEYGEPTMVFETSLSIQQIRFLLETQDDTHVAIQTLALESEYTGERNYNL